MRPSSLPQPNYRFAETIKRLLRRNASPSLKKILARTHPVDIAHVLDSFLPQERQKLLTYVGDDERQSEVIACLPPDHAAEVLTEMPLERAAVLLREMSGDDRADILGILDEEVAAKFLAALPQSESEEVAELLRYGENTAGGIMSPDPLAIQEDTTAEQAIRIVRDSPDVEMAFYIYVVNDHNSLVGVVSLRQLVTSKPEIQLWEVMNPHVVSVRTDEHQEEVARLVSRYDFLAVPVVDETNQLVGVITVDDVIDVIREEATEDILKMAGAGDEYAKNVSVFGWIRRRLPWLAAAWFGGIVAAMIIGKYRGTIERSVQLAAFIPVIIGMAGNVGTQSLTIVVRGLATRNIEVKHFWKVVGREIIIGVLLGLLFGAAIGATGFFDTYESAELNALSVAIVVAIAASLSMVLAATVGALMPLVFAKIHIDPAVATGPFVTTAIDVIGVSVYLGIATAII